MIRTQVYIPEELYQQAKFYAHINSISISELMRSGLQTVISKIDKKHTKKNPLEAMVGKYVGGKDLDITESHNDIYKI